MRAPFLGGLCARGIGLPSLASVHATRHIFINGTHTTQVFVLKEVFGLVEEVRNARKHETLVLV